MRASLDSRQPGRSLLDLPVDVRGTRPRGLRQTAVCTQRPHGRTVILKYEGWILRGKNARKIKGKTRDTKETQNTKDKQNPATLLPRRLARILRYPFTKIFVSTVFVLPKLHVRKGESKGEPPWLRRVKRGSQRESLLRRRRHEVSRALWHKN